MVRPEDPRSPLPAPEELIFVGIVRKPHGVAGEASVEPWTDDPASLADIERAWLVSPGEDQVVLVNIASIRAHQNRLLIRFAEIDSPESMAGFKNWLLGVRPAEARALEKGEYYLHDLEGLEIVDIDGNVLGRVDLASEGGGGTLLTVRRADGTTFDVPFVREFCREIDPHSGRIVVALPTGMANLDEAELVEEAPSGRSRVHKEPAPRRNAAEIRIDVVTIFPSMFTPFLEEGVLARALEENLIELRIWDLREFATDRHRSTDDEAYGGGGGMVMLADPAFRSIETIRDQRKGRPWVVLMSPQGAVFRQEVARDLARRDWIVLLCGRYEGFDERIQVLIDQEISVGDFVVSGGEVPALLVIDAVGRMVEGVVGCRNSVEADSFYNGLLDHPHYTRPADFRGLRVPEVLLSGHAENIRKWRKKESLRATLRKRPDLLETVELDEEARGMILEIDTEEGFDRDGE